MAMLASVKNFPFSVFSLIIIEDNISLKVGNPNPQQF
jgi:hypothetical protein